MQAARQRGLSGKARKVRYRNRAARLYARQMIDEYLQPAPPRPGGLRYVPIRGRREFLPSIIHAGEIGARNTGPQLELPLTARDDAGGTPRSSEKKRPATRHTTGSVNDARNPVSRPPAFDPRMLKPEPAARSRRSKTFTLSGFLVGCAMGSAAAALVLLVVQTALR